MSPELLAPAGSFDAALAAFQQGADAVYLGLPRFSARAEAENFTEDQARALLAFAHEFTPHKKVYLTLNTLVKESEIPDLLAELERIVDLAPDGLIVQDLGLARVIRNFFPSLALHASTQLAAHSLESVLALKELGFTRVVLAREVSLSDIREIVEKSGVEIEIFIHGALCYSISGLCLFSSLSTGRSGNRGRCAYCCREAFHNNPASPPRFPFSMKDLALGPLIAETLATGAHSLKIEGRMKNACYVACVTHYYRELIDHAPQKWDEETSCVQDLQTIFSRPWTSLYATGPHQPVATLIDPVGMGHRGARIGFVKRIVRDRDGSKWLHIHSHRAIGRHDGIQIDLPSGGKPYGFSASELRYTSSKKREIQTESDREIEIRLPENDLPAIPIDAPVFCASSQTVKNQYAISRPRIDPCRTGIPFSVTASLLPDRIDLSAQNERDTSIRVDLTFPATLSPANHPERTEEAVRKAFSKTGDSPWTLAHLTCNDPQHLYAPLSILNDARRILLEKLTAIHTAAHQNHLNAIRIPPSARQPSTEIHSPSTTILYPIQEKPFPTLFQANRLVLGIGHLSPTDTLTLMLHWAKAANHQTEIRPALPLITWNEESDSLDETIQLLLRHGFPEWECSDLSGCRRLRRLGAQVRSLDWSGNLFNHFSAETWAEWGIKEAVLSPELDEAALLDLAQLSPIQPACLLFQHTPLFLSKTRPSVPGTDDANLTNRKGEDFHVLLRDNLWATVSETPFSLADERITDSFSNHRIDLFWTPHPEQFEQQIEALLQGKPLTLQTKVGNVKRGLR